jgi:hypothetical protein
MIDDNRQKRDSGSGFYSWLMCLTKSHKQENEAVQHIKHFVRLELFKTRCGWTEAAIRNRARCGVVCRDGHAAVAEEIKSRQNVSGF